MTPQEITRAREDLGLTQRALAEHLGVAANTVWRWQAGTAIPAPYLPLAFDGLRQKLAVEPRLCGAEGSRGRVCAAQAGHAGDHQLVLRSTRED